MSVPMPKIMKNFKHVKGLTCASLNTEILPSKNEYISKGVSQNCSTALNKHLCECQVRHCSATTVRDMTLIFSSACRSSRGGTQTAHEIFIRPLLFSADGFEVDTFENFLFFKFLLYLLQKQEFLFLQ